MKPAAAGKTGQPEKAPRRPAASGHTRVRARAKAVDRKSKRARVDFIAQVMADLDWERGKTGPMLAELWGLSLKSVEGDAAEASRRVTSDPNEARRDITAGCRKLFREAVQGGNAKDAKAVGELWATVSGAKTPEEHVVMTTAANPAEAARLVREAFGEKAMPSSSKPNGLNGHPKPNGTGTVPPPPAGE